ncbi:hypothetical protein Cst_c20740 [Thermoclostridium stercorarium subsp. stercorarium DSM 8532]|uniref:Lipoprotein YerB n=3 Tax=Thermoclostridium stercorarium TaxID=1510 RepID=L7VQG6_THES1|nr:DUF3048 domain-containing protein [Thermoclostridium stercorarium]AGC69047.1 hypothetical protein Cst_c20740 [Thermoclostridium stercorarium subsp. stercorarium DSM 8532]AGI40021.1 hypothetical protein Clst_1982 [Thermoclostridium stercorarium subsp. stercorarium DSM 8532]ANW99339.1 hypothetical protein CSTERTH_10000 [Thermoclostridium stercorarium subsp. thermolacticum DSM 2910]ANX01968.1 hypothetical protein CSTERLE_10490 [Thermoclostridium stercorarium subsp. leptospartum DSM 9219]UZQ850
MSKINIRDIIRNITSSKKGVIIMSVLLFVISTATTFLIAQSAKRSNGLDTAIVDTEITPEPTPEETEDLEPAGNDENEYEIGDKTEDKNNITPTPSPTPVKKAIDFNFPKAGTRPIAVMIDNETDAVLPQGGLGTAQVVYEALVEYGDTRYMALFWNNLPDYIGPVRSARHYFLDYAMEYDAIYTHIGWSDYAYRDLQLFDIDNIDGVMSDASGVFWDLTDDKSNYHDSYTSRERIDNFLKKSGYSLTTDKKFPFTYNTEDMTYKNGESAKEVFIKYSVSSSCGYYYDEEAGNYKRTRLGEFQTDRNTNEVIRVKNIIILFVKNETIEGDRYGRQELYTTGSGKGYYISNGVKQDITWVKSSRDSQTRYLDANNKEITINPGNTWIQIVPPNADVRIR